MFVLNLFQSSDLYLHYSDIPVSTTSGLQCQIQVLIITKSKHSPFSYVNVFLDTLQNISIKFY